MSGAPLGPVDHVGYLAGDLAAGEALLLRLTGGAVARRFELPQFGIAGVFLGCDGRADVEVFTRAGHVAERVVLDHVAHVVEDLDAVAARLAAGGVRFAGPDLRTPAPEPFAIGGARSLWTLPETTGGVCLQLTER